MNCRKCGACCIAPWIVSPLPGMPHGKLAGVRCANLDAGNRCVLFGKRERPASCLGWQPTAEICGNGFDEAMSNIAVLEEETAQ